MGNTRPDFSSALNLTTFTNVSNQLISSYWPFGSLSLPRTAPSHSKMASALFFLDLKGKTLLARNYRGDIPMSAVEKFPILLSEAEEESSTVPPQSCRSLHRVFQRAGRRINTGQLCYHLRVAGRDDGFWTSADYGIEDLTRIHHTGVAQAGGPSTPPNSSHKRRIVAIRRYQIPKERSLPRCCRISQPPRLFERQCPAL